MSTSPVSQSTTDLVVQTALTAISHGYTPIPVGAKSKKKLTSGWTAITFTDDDEGLAEVREKFTDWAEEGFTNVSLLPGSKSSNLVDVDLDHPKTARLKDFFLPPTPMRTGRAGSRNSHYWYRAEEGTLPATRRHKMPRDPSQKDGEVIVELRGDGTHTVIPPSVHPSGEDYLWEGEEWGIPTVVDGRVLTVQVALLGLGTVLIDNWPIEGGRHEAYLALAGGLLRNVNGGVHPYWERNLPVLIHALAEATLDDDGGDGRVKEVMETTIRRIHSGGMVAGFGKLGEIIGEPHAKQARVLVREVESAAGYKPRESEGVELTNDVTPAGAEASDSGDFEQRQSVHDAEIGGLDPEDRDPLQERLGTWQPLDLDPYLSGNVKMQDPEVLTRDDGHSLMYRGRVNMLYGSSESAKSWIALQTCLQEMEKGERVVYLDFEDEPINTLDRLNRLGAGQDDIRHQFSYIRPEDPIAEMQRDRFGQEASSDPGRDNSALFKTALDRIDPSLIVADGMTVLYGLHGLNPNDAVNTDVITGWLKRLTRNGRTTVIVIDHAGKGGKRGESPIGSQHKVAMVQGALLQAWPISQPRPGALGEVELIVLKDRPGRVREHAQDSGGDKAQVAALCRIDSREGNTTKLTFNTAPNAMTALDKGIIDASRAEAAERAEKGRMWDERVKHVYEGELGRSYSLKEISEALADFEAPGQVKAAVLRLVDQGWLAKVGKTRAQKYELIVGEAETLYGDPDAEPKAVADSNTPTIRPFEPWGGMRSESVDLYSVDL